VEHTFDDLDRLSIDTIRALSMDAVQRANSGHPGTPMALAPVAYLLYTRFLKHNPANPLWPDRDRFVLSCGHASMLLYSILHLTGYDLSLDDLRDFRQWGSITAGHPEWGMAPGVEVTTGPLGQGCGVSVGMAIAEAHMAARFNRRDHAVVDHMTWVLCSDGDLMEGIAGEAASLAGHLRLGKLVWIWDDNRITIEGSTDLSFSENVAQRFEGYGWQVLEVGDVNDLEALAATFESARGADRPSLIAVRSHIAWGSPNKQDTADAHGAPLGDDEIRRTKEVYGLPADESFHVPEGVRERCRSVDRGLALEADWVRLLALWRHGDSELAAEWVRRIEGTLPDGWQNGLPSFADGDAPMATRAASGKVLNGIADALPELVGGSADLAPSCKTLISASDDLTAERPGGRNLHFGIREHAMAAALNGMSLHGGMRPFGSTFLVFSDYMRPSIRLAALMNRPVIYVFTHDSIWVGEDGPTHQPVEHIAALRAIPGLVVLRPADANETAVAWRVAVERTDGPTALILSRQGLPVLEKTSAQAGEGVPKGAYRLGGSDGDPDIVVLATGSEVQLAVRARDELAERGVTAWVVSMPSWELLEDQPADYHKQIFPEGVPRLAVEAAISLGWRRWVGDDGAVLGIDRFGASAPGKVVAERLGFTVDHVVRLALGLVGRL
jgi:transketolase